MSAHLSGCHRHCAILTRRSAQPSVPASLQTLDSEASQSAQEMQQSAKLLREATVPHLGRTQNRGFHTLAGWDKQAPQGLQTLLVNRVLACEPKFLEDTLALSASSMHAVSNAFCALQISSVKYRLFPQPAKNRSPRLCCCRLAECSLAAKLQGIDWGTVPQQVPSRVRERGLEQGSRRIR